MPQCIIQPRTWYVEFGLDVSAAPAFAVDGFEGGRRIRSLQFVSFAYKSTDPADTTPDPACRTADIVDVVGFVHGTESILDTTIRSWIEDPRVMDQQWKPVSIQGALKEAPVATGGRMIQLWLSSGAASAVAAPAWTGCAVATRQHRL